jgi:hypothetical protein
VLVDVLHERERGLAHRFSFGRGRLVRRHRSVEQVAIVVERLRVLFESLLERAHERAEAHPPVIAPGERHAGRRRAVAEARAQLARRFRAA